MDQAAGFSLLELLLVIALIALLAALLLPSLARAKTKSQGAVCLNNLRQLMVAVSAYAGDNGEFYPPNPNGGNCTPGHNWCAGQAGPGGAQEFNPEVLKDPSLTLVSPYVDSEAAVFKCPADARFGLYQGTDPSLSNQTVASARTYSMNQAVGTICPAFDADGSSHGGAPSLSPDGPYLDYPQSQRRDSPWFTYGKTTDHPGAPGAARLWVVTEEDPASINDAAFAFAMSEPTWIDFPGTAHVRACSLGFADGHVEIHGWISGDTAVVQGNVERGTRIEPPFTDWLWMRARTSANRSGTLPAPAP